MKLVSFSIFVVALGLLCFVSSQTLNRNLPIWRSYKTMYSKQYRHMIEDYYRMSVFYENKAKIDIHNELFRKGLVNYTLALNQFADLTSEEFAQTMNGYRGTQSGRKSHEVYVKPENLQIPSSIDWRSKGYVTSVKDQGQCGSCWAFSATGALEGQHYAKYKKLVSLSEQNLIDCTLNYGNNGCTGGLMDYAFDYVINNGGIDTEQSYPYTMADGPCRYNSAYKGATCVGYVDIPSGDESSLQYAVGSVGPVSVAIDASQMSFQFYSSGVYYDAGCSSTMLDHGVLAVGYGSENGQDYWLVKNSWGTSWGDNGYIKMARNRYNNCGIATVASYPKV